MTHAFLEEVLPPSCLIFRPHSAANGLRGKINHGAILEPAGSQRARDFEFVTVLLRYISTR
jgi:hypothetical protein